VVAVILLLALQAPTDPELPHYAPDLQVKGALVSSGSDTLNNLITLWFEELYRRQPGLKLALAGGSSGFGALSGLLSGQADLAAMTRLPTESELEKWQAAKGHPPVLLPVALDAIGVYVHKDNPLRQITLVQLDAVWSRDRKRAFPKNIATWGDLGLEGVWAAKPIALYGRNNLSGSYLFFKTNVLLGGDFKAECNEVPQTAAVLGAVSKDLFAMGFGALPSQQPGTRALRIAPDPDSPAIAPTPETARSGKYPLSRYLYVAIDKDPAKPVSPAVREFFRFVYSRQGQEIVIKDGWFPMTAEQSRAELKKLD
jgi:phosphate transport system substrate-binding protein